MKILITICARGGSKGIIGKNIKPINGKPLIGYTIEIAKEIQKKFDAKIALSTDSLHIKDTANIFEIYTDYKRPDFLATDNAGKIETIRDLLNYEESLINKKFDYILDLDVTSPLRNVQDIFKSFELLFNDPNALNIFSVNNAARNPYFNMVEQNEHGYYSTVKNIKEGNLTTRQSSPKVYDLNASFYFYRRSFFEQNLNSAITQKSLVYIMNHICFDLDHEIDFLFMEFLIKENKLDFKL